MMEVQLSGRMLQQRARLERLDQQAEVQLRRRRPGVRKQRARLEQIKEDQQAEVQLRRRRFLKKWAWKLLNQERPSECTMTCSPRNTTIALSA